MAFCKVCGEEFSERRFELGYRTCLEHGEARRTFLVIPVPKSNGVVGNIADLKGISSSHKTGVSM